jgi:molybdopterin converting factor small subunit
VTSKGMEQEAAHTESQMIKVKVLCFAQARDLASSKEEPLEVSKPAYVNDLVSKAIETHPRLGGIRQMLRVIVNGIIEYDKNVELHDGDTVALMPPIVGD